MLERELLDDAMRRALALAHRSPADNPNPQVGCVLLDPDGRIVAEGWHRGAGTPHAEVDALAHLPAEWQQRTRELTAVVTLEPCNHSGRTGPCATALATAGIGAVVYSATDPGAEAGGGAQTLRSAGVAVLGGVHEEAGRALIAPWLACTAHSPAPAPAPTPAPAAARTAAAPTPGLRVTVKWAQTLDGRAAAADGTSQWITGPEARADVHRRRAAADAILVGTGTLFADDPTLTARDARGDLLVPAAEQPIPVVLGWREIPAQARVRRHPALTAHGLTAPIHYTGEDLAAHFADLAARGVKRLFIEGGPSVASAVLAAGLADEVLVYIAPALLGGPRLAIHDLDITSMSGITRLELTELTRLGDDVLLTATIRHTPKEP